MATTVVKHGVLLFVVLALNLVPARCGLLRRDQQNAEAQCASDAVLTAFKAQGAQSFCSAYLPNMLQSINALSITTVVIASTTITAEKTSEPTLDITVMADYETVTTTTMQCLATAVPQVAGLPALATGALPVGVGHARVKGRAAGEVAAAASTGAVVVPPYAAALQPAQISSACSCIVSVPPTPTTLQLATVTSYAKLFTTTLVDLGDIPVVNYVTFGATRKLIVTECA